MVSTALLSGIIGPIEQTGHHHLDLRRALTHYGHSSQGT